MENEKILPNVKAAILRKKIIKSTEENIQNEDNLVIKEKFVNIKPVLNFYKVGFNSNEEISEGNAPIYIKALSVDVYNGDLKFYNETHEITNVFSKGSGWVYCVKLNDDGSLNNNIIQWPGQVHTRVLIDPAIIPDIVKTEVTKIREELESSFNDRLMETVTKTVENMLGEDNVGIIEDDSPEEDPEKHIP